MNAQMPIVPADETPRTTSANCPQCGVAITGARLAEFGGCALHPRNALGWGPDVTR
jgi:hypothetical protein